MSTPLGNQSNPFSWNPEFLILGDLGRTHSQSHIDFPDLPSHKSVIESVQRILCRRKGLHVTIGEQTPVSRDDRRNPLSFCL